MEQIYLILGSQALFLVARDCPDRIPAFKEAFSEVWRQINHAGNAADLATIVAHWERDGGVACVCLVSNDPDLPPHLGPAVTDGDGLRRMRFDCAMTFNFPDPAWLVLTIAHELAHVWLYATDDPTHHAKPSADPVEHREWDYAREDRADETVKRWGFDMDQYCRLIGSLTERRVRQ